MKLFLCEKPSQARDIAKVLGAGVKGDGHISGNGVAVTWCVGHLLEQAPPEHYDEGLKFWDIARLPVIPVEWKMEVKNGAKKQFDIIAGLLKQASEVVVSTDADREGEVIGREVMQLCGYKGKVSRLWLSALDDASVRKALAKLLPGDQTLALYHAGVARSRADWLAGMNLTMAYTAVYGTGGGKKGVVSVGRVQTPTLALIVARDREIENFKPKDYFDVTANWQTKGGALPTRWLPPVALVDDAGRCLDKKTAQAAVNKVQGQVGHIVKAETKPDKEPAPLLFSLSALQQEASRLYGVSVKDVLDAAQGLYETHKATSYPRTDCQFLPESQFADAGLVLAAIAGVDPGIADLTRRCDRSLKSRAWNDKKITAHHAIVPTANAGVDMAKMNALERKIYDLVRRRYIAQFLGDHEFMATVIEVVCQEETFRATGRTPVKPGWKLAIADAQPEAKKRAGKKTEDDAGESADAQLPQVSVNEQVRNLDARLLEKKTKPPQRYTEGTLVKDMESIGKLVTDAKFKAVLKETAGIGTEATRAGIIQNLFQREYIQQEGKKYLLSTDKGRNLIDILPLALTDPATTARWEQALESVAEGKARMEDFMLLQAQWITELVGKVKLEAKSRPARSPIGGSGAGDARYPCPACHKPMRLIPGAKGAFWGCTSYPECKHTLPDDGGKPGAREVGGKSPAPPSNIGDKCPDCNNGVLVQRFSKEKGKGFIGCNRFPDCRHFEWATT